MKQVSIITDNILGKILDKKTRTLKKIIFHWVDIAGEDLSQYSEPIKIEESNDKKVLVVSVHNSSASSELHYVKESIIDKISFFIGSIVVEDIKILLRPRKRQ